MLTSLARRIFCRISRTFENILEPEKSPIYQFIPSCYYRLRLCYYKLVCLAEVSLDLEITWLLHQCLKPELLLIILPLTRANYAFSERCVGNRLCSG